MFFFSDLRKRLARHYQKTLNSVPLSPLMSDQDELLGKMYVAPRIVKTRTSGTASHSSIPINHPQEHNQSWELRAEDRKTPQIHQTLKTQTRKPKPLPTPCKHHNKPSCELCNNCKLGEMAGEMAATEAAMGAEMADTVAAEAVIAEMGDKETT